MAKMWNAYQESDSQFSPETFSGDQEAYTSLRPPPGLSTQTLYGAEPMKVLLHRQAPSAATTAVSTPSLTPLATPLTTPLTSPELRSHPAAGNANAAGGKSRGGKGQQQQQQQQQVKQQQPHKGATPGEKTSLVIRNLPDTMSRELLLCELDTTGDLACVDFVYVCISLDDKRCNGQAYLNFLTEAMAVDFKERWHGRKEVGGISCNRAHRKMKLNVAWAHYHGFEACVKHNKHKHVKDESMKAWIPKWREEGKACMEGTTPPSPVTAAPALNCPDSWLLKPPQGSVDVSPTTPNWSQATPMRVEFRAGKAPAWQVQSTLGSGDFDLMSQHYLGTASEYSYGTPSASVDSSSQDGYVTLQVESF